MTAPTPDVTVVLPTRNRRALLADALASVAGQRDVTTETIVIDEGSTDGTAEFLRTHTLPGLRVIRHDAPRGVSNARNAGIAEARAPWIAFLDDDDVWAPTWLAAALRAAGAGADARMVYGGRWAIDEHRAVRDAMLAVAPEVVVQEVAFTNCVGVPSSVLVHASVLAEAGGFDPALSALADWEAWIRFAPVANPVAVSDLLVGYTTYAGNMHVRNPRAIVTELDRMVGLPSVRSATNGASVHDQRFVRWLAAESQHYGHRRASAQMWLLSAGRFRSPGDVLRAAYALAVPAHREPAYATPEWLTAFRAPKG
jgi:hypothetical protein